MKKVYLHLLTVSFVLNCIGTASAVNWVKKDSPFPGDAGENAVSFVIGSKAYVGTGYLYKNYQNEYFDDFWQYDSETEIWTKIADFPGDARNEAISFSANGKGYVGLGYSRSGWDSFYYKDFYEYDPENDTWTKIADFPDARTGSVVFVINDVAYVGTGYDRDLEELKSDFYKYESGKWTAVASLPTDEARDNATAYALHGQGYVVSGGYGPGVFGATDSVWEYDPVSNTWKKNGYFSIASNLLRSYVSNNTPYVLLRNELYKYDSEDGWLYTGTVLDDMKDISNPTLFVINNIPYLTLGTYGGFFDSFENSDLWYDADAVKANSIGNSTTVTKKMAVNYYNIRGQKLSQEPENGLYIILYDDGTSEKVIKR